MKKLFCTLLALAAVFCFAGCVNHNDGKCDECGENGKLDFVKQYDEKSELCLECAIEIGLDELDKELNGDK